MPEIMQLVSYLIDDTADGGTSLHGLDWLTHGGTLSDGLVSDAVVKVEAALRESLKVI